MPCRTATCGSVHAGPSSYVVHGEPCVPFGELRFIAVFPTRLSTRSPQTGGCLHVALPYAGAVVLVVCLL